MKLFKLLSVAIALYGMAYNFYKGVFSNVKDATVTNPGCDKHDLVTYNK